jgi:hypothetical protein
MSTMPRPKAVLPPGIGWQLWTVAALPFLASCGELNSHPVSGMTGAQRALIAATLCCLQAQRPCRAPRQTGRAGEASIRWQGTTAHRRDRLRRAVDALARGGVWLWWRQRDGAPWLDLLFLRVGG